MTAEKIIIKGARQNNLKNISVEIPHYAITAVIGISGSGKSSLVFDLIARESQRIYSENFYSGKALKKIPSRPDMDSIKGLFPVVVVEQDESVRSARSTVGTFTELYDFLRLIFARFSTSPDGEEAPRTMFSFNRAEGWCPVCQGLGVEDHIETSKIVGDPKKSLREKALKISTPNGYIMYSQVTLDELDKVCHAHGFSVDTPWGQLTEEQKEVIWNGSERVRVLYGKHPLENRLKWAGITAKPREEGYYKGVLSVMEDILRRDRNPGILRFAGTMPCNGCRGKRLSEKALSYQWQGLSIADFHQMSIENLHAFFETPEIKLSLPKEISEEILSRTQIICSLGLGHLQLDRLSGTLSGPETGRLKLASQVNSGLGHLLYILDEPGTGLHESETDPFMMILRKLVSQQNTVIIVSHDEKIIRQCDYIIELGPEAGFGGGEVQFCGSSADYFSKPGVSEMGARVAEDKTGGDICFSDIRFRNLNIEEISLKKSALNIISGKSGGGKTALLEYLEFWAGNEKKDFDKVVYVDSSPIGRMPSSNVATYTGMSDYIRDVFSQTPEAKKRKIGKSFFSFNVSGGRCEECNGAGVVSTGMHFLGVVHTLCEVCNGQRFQPFILDVRYKGLNIHEILNLTIDEALLFFAGEDKIRRYLSVLSQLGLGYLTLGQPSPTLSGGEAQRVKLASELVVKSKGNTLYLMDEPSAGLHPKDAALLIGALKQLCEKGNTVIASENNDYFMVQADRLFCLEKGRLVALKNFLRSAPKNIVAEYAPKISEDICFKGIRTHYLDIPVFRFPLKKITCISGLSGSGKSSLAIDTIYAESKKRLIENLSAYFRQMTGIPGNPEFESVEGLIPAIALEKKSPDHNPRSIVATYCGIHDLLRLAYSRFGKFPEGQALLLSSAFSFNHESGACPVCKGLGFRLECDENLFVSDANRTLFDGAWGGNSIIDFYVDPHGQYIAILAEIEKQDGVDFHLPWRMLPEESKNIILRGNGEKEYEVKWNFKRGKTTGSHEFQTKWKGLFSLIEDEFFLKQYSRRGEQIGELLHEVKCPVCKGGRLKPEVLSVTLNGKNISEAISMNSQDLLNFISLCDIHPEIKTRILQRLDAIIRVGISYLNLNRLSSTLSGGEFQRLRMAGLLHTPLTGMLYILDEPSFGLGRDEIENMSEIILGFKEQGNTVLLIDQHSALQQIADKHFVMGPGAGKNGGTINEVSWLQLSENSVCIVPIIESSGRTNVIVHRVDIRNLSLPVFCFNQNQLTVIRGASGSGKSTILRDVLYPTFSQNRPVYCSSFTPANLFGHVYFSGQENTEGASNTDIVGYLGFSLVIAKIFAAHAPKGGPILTNKHFMTGSREGKCKSCGGNGYVRLSLDFWGDDISLCESCNGERFEKYITEIKVQGYSISELLKEDLSVLTHFLTIQKIIPVGEKLFKVLNHCRELGLDYLPLGQWCSTLSGGEFQRLKLARECATFPASTLLLLDEPSGGLAPEDTTRLISFIDQLLANGHTVVCASHDEMLIKASNGLVDLG